MFTRRHRTRSSRPRRLALLALAGAVSLGSLTGLSLSSPNSNAQASASSTAAQRTPPPGFTGQWRFGPKRCDVDFYANTGKGSTEKYASLAGGDSVQLDGNRGGLAMLVKAGFGNDTASLSKAQELMLVANTIDFESAWCPGAYNRQDFGLTQINKRWHPRLNRKYDLSDPQQAIKAMRELFLANARVKSRSGRTIIDFEKGLKPWHAHGSENEKMSRNRMLSIVEKWLDEQAGPKK